MSRPRKLDNKEVTNLKNGYQLEVVRPKDIFDDLGFSNPDDVEICKSIITQLESKSATILVQGGTVALPYIGRLRKPLVRQEINKQRHLLKVARSVMNKEDYQQYKKDLYLECVNKIASEDERKKIKKRLIALNKKQYLQKYKNFGETGANLWIDSLMWLKGIEFNQEVQDVFDEIAIHENNNRKANYR